MRYRRFFFRGCRALSLFSLRAFGLRSGLFRRALCTFALLGRLLCRRDGRLL
jgi:hypothetical protein